VVHRSDEIKRILPSNSSPAIPSYSTSPPSVSRSSSADFGGHSSSSTSSPSPVGFSHFRSLSQQVPSPSSSSPTMPQSGVYDQSQQGPQSLSIQLPAALKKSGSKKNLFGAAASGSASASPISPSPTTPHGGAGPEPDITGPRPKEDRNRTNDDRFSVKRPLQVEKQRSHTDSQLTFMLKTPRPEGREGPFIHYTVTDILEVVSGRQPKKPDSLNFPDIYLSISTPVSSQEVIERHPVDRSSAFSERPSSRQRGERSRTRSRRKGSAGKSASTLSTVTTVPESPQRQTKSPGGEDEDCATPRPSSAFDDEEEDFRPRVWPGSNGVHVIAPGLANSRKACPLTSSGSTPNHPRSQPLQGPSLVVLTGKALADSTALHDQQPSDHSLRAKVDNLFLGSSPDSDEEPEEDSAARGHHGQPVFSSTGQAAYPHTSLGSPSSPRRSRHVSEPRKMKN